MTFSPIRIDLPAAVLKRTTHDDAPNVRARLGALCVAGVILLSLTAGQLAHALGPDEIALVVNTNEPEGMKLAKHYAEVRHVPDGRIIELDLPNSEGMDFNRYESDVVPPIRKFLRDNALDKKLTCLVTFYGVPFRISAKEVTPAEKDELLAVRKQLHETQASAADDVGALERLASKLTPIFKPATGDGTDELVRRSEGAMGAFAQGLERLAPADRAAVMNEFVPILTRLGGPVEVAVRIGTGVVRNPAAPDAQRQMWADRLRQAQQIQKLVVSLQEKAYDPAMRKSLRDTMRDNLGVLGLCRMLELQIRYLDVGSSAAQDTTASCLDNELALLWWNYYPRRSWNLNPLYFRIGQSQRSLPVMMVMRLDAPTPQIVQNIIDTSVKVEAEGLAGCIALDSTGEPLLDPKGEVNARGRYDQTIRNLADLVRSKTKLKMVFDQRKDVFAPGSVKDVAVYCGWYSVQHYIPGCQFNAGAVGFHIASFEMLSLRDGSRTGWVAGLLKDGVVDTVGPVAEPYLHSFPVADEYFPLLFTGKLTMAEVYWKTCPLTSWMISAIGDPLYTPYKINPPLKVEDLPEALKAVFAVKQGADGAAAGRLVMPAESPAQASPPDNR